MKISVACVHEGSFSDSHLQEGASRDPFWSVLIKERKEWHGQPRLSIECSVTEAIPHQHAIHSLQGKERVAGPAYSSRNV